MTWKSHIFELLCTSKYLADLNDLAFTYKGMSICMLERKIKHVYRCLPYQRLPWKHPSGRNYNFVKCISILNGSIKRSRDCSGVWSIYWHSTRANERNKRIKNLELFILEKLLHFKKPCFSNIRKMSHSIHHLTNLSHSMYNPIG